MILQKIHRTVPLILAITLAFLTMPVSAQAQKAVTNFFRGVVTDAETGKPVEMAFVKIPTLGLWAMSDKNGSFTIKGLRNGTYEYTVSLLGYSTYTDKVAVTGRQADVRIKLHVQTLGLNEVVVTAKEKRNNSTSKIDEAAITHLQPKSVQDLLQLVPGNITQNPDLNTVGQAQIREIGENSDNAQGAAIIINGSPLSNDANMQVLASTRSGNTLNSYDEQSTAGRGIDLRTISPDNIESLEVIRGIPSVEYGNLTSGAVIIKTKSGYTPLEAKAKIDPYSKMFYAGKGIQLKNNGGALNISGDYSQSYTDIRKKYNGYDRITGSLGYSNLFMKSTKPLTFNAHLDVYSTLNSRKSDPQLKTREKIKNENYGLRFSLDGNWRLDNKWVSNLAYNFMLSASRQKDDYNELVTLQTGITPVADSYVSGEYQTHYLSSSYYSHYIVDGKPLDLYGQVKADKIMQFKNDGYDNIKVGIEYRYNKNNGKGMTFNPLLPPIVTDVHAIRPRSYESIPGMGQFTAFAENKWHQPVGTTSFTLQAGARFTNQFIDKAQALRGDIFTVDPRVNLEYNVLNKQNNSLFDDLTFSFGYGINSKLPTLLQLYPESSYFDVRSIAAMPTRADPIAVMTTKVIENTANKDLKPARNNKIEFGINAAIKKFTANITLFSEHTSNDFGYTSRHVIFPYRTFSVPAGVSAMDYTNGMLHYVKDGATYDAAVKNDTTFESYLTPSNKIDTKKRGIEYSLNFGQIPFIRTSVVVDGAYLWIKRRSKEESYNIITTSYLGGHYPYMAVMPSGSGSVSERFNTNFRFITHLPKLKMVFSTTAQVIWKQTVREIYETDGGKKHYYKADGTGSAGGTRYATDPLGFYDFSGNYHEWNKAYNADGVYNAMVRSYSNSNYFGKENYPTTVLLNFRLTKEMGKILELSFLANNFLKMSKISKNKTSKDYTELNTPYYFGAELKIKL